jgi:hypothetical protein
VKREHHHRAGRTVRPSSLSLLALLCALPWVARADSLSSAIYVRSDSEDTLVVSPRARAAKLFEQTELDLSYAADVWTSASIDIRTSASPAVTEQRDEIDASATHELTADLTLTGSFRYSGENDYTSNGGSLGGALEMADNNTTLALNLSLYHDDVGRSGDPEFDQSLTTVGARGTFTQVLDPDMLAQLTYEVSSLNGYQASAYRFVGFGGTGYGCQRALQCLPEHLPDGRLRHAIDLLARRALSDDLSAQVDYRLYLDDWSLTSHTIAAELGWFLLDETLLTLRFRYYTQSGAEFYQRVYAQVPAPTEFWSRDRELSEMSSKRIGADIDQHVYLDGEDLTLVLTASGGVIFYTYPNFVGLDSVSAYEMTFAVGLER